MAQTLVQTSAEVSFTGTSSTQILNGVAALNALSVVAGQLTDGTLFANVSDDKSGVWTTKQSGTAGNGVGMVAVAGGVAGGNTTVTVGPSSGSKACRFKFQEWSGSQTNPPDAFDTRDQTASTNHAESAAGINPSGGCIVITASSCANNLTTPAVGSGYNAITSAGGSVWWQYQIFPSAPVSETGSWSSANSTAQSGAIVAIKAAGGAAFVPWGNMASWADMEPERTRIVAY